MMVSSIRRRARRARRSASPDRRGYRRGEHGRAESGAGYGRSRSASSRGQVRLRRTCGRRYRLRTPTRNENAVASTKRCDSRLRARCDVVSGESWSRRVGFEESAGVDLDVRHRHASRSSSRASSAPRLSSQSTSSRRLVRRRGRGRNARPTDLSIAHTHRVA